MRSATRVVSFAPSSNTPGKKDATGAFLPEQLQFSALMRQLGATTQEFSFNNLKPNPARIQEVSAGLKSAGGYDLVAFFCHGWLDGIQAGFRRSSVSTFAEMMSASATGPMTVVLYCCSTGADEKKRSLTAAGTGDNSFADRLRDELCKRGQTQARVVAHSTAAHTTRNPNVLFFEGMGSPIGGMGGIAPVVPGRPLWKPWCASLKNSDLRFRYPLMEVAEIHAELANDNNV